MGSPVLVHKSLWQIAIRRELQKTEVAVSLIALATINFSKLVP
jgi:hypothetical protein